MASGRTAVDFGFYYGLVPKFRLPNNPPTEEDDGVVYGLFDPNNPTVVGCGSFCYFVG